MTNVIGDGVKAVVLDLRDNAGGALDAAVAVCDMLLPAGKTIVETRGRDGELRERYATTDDGRVFSNLPLAVIVNQNSASAAEIVAACLQDHQPGGRRRASAATAKERCSSCSVGTGKSLLKLTWASFWRPSGANIHRMPARPKTRQWGVVPDAGFERRLTPDEYAAYRNIATDRDLFGRRSRPRRC